MDIQMKILINQEQDDLFGMMAPAMMEIGSMAKHKVKADSFILMEIFILDNGKKINQMVKEFIIIWMEVNILDIG